MTELEKRDAGLWYDANYDPNVLKERMRADSLCFELNMTPPADEGKREKILKQLLPHRQKHVALLSPFYADYGYNCFIGEATFLNHGVYMMDCARITLGSHCFIGPDCGFYTASHPLLAQERNQGLERVDPITLEDNVWLGAKVSVMPGVMIGTGSVIGAGSVVTKDIPSYVVAAGNPCRVLRPITADDSVHRPESIKADKSGC